MAKKEGRGTTKNIFFRNEEMNFTMLRALLGVYYEGANTGECLWLAQNTKNGDFETYIKGWEKLGKQNMELALKTTNTELAREYFFKAANYFKSAMISLNPTDVRHKECWAQSVKCFEDATALLPYSTEKIPVELDHKVLPCYYISANPDKKNPVVFLVTGGEGSNVEMYFWVGAYALKNGFSVLLYEGPGNISTIYTSGLRMVANSEVAIGKALDVLCRRKDVDTEKIAMMGISFGGYLVSRAAIFDKRITALIPNSPLTNTHKMLAAVLPSLVFKLPDGILNFIKKYFMSYADRATLDLLLWEGGVDNFRDAVKILADYTIEGLESKITCPVLALAAEGEGKEFERQINGFMQNINSEEKAVKIFTNVEGAGSHCQVDNHRLMNEVVISWLKKIWNI